MKFPKLVIVSNGDCAAALLDGVFIGKGIKRLDFSTKDDEKNYPGGVIRVMDLSVSSVQLEAGDTAEKKFAEFMEGIAKEDRTCLDKGGPEVTE